MTPDIAKLRDWLQARRYDPSVGCDDAPKKIPGVDPAPVGVQIDGGPYVTLKQPGAVLDGWDLTQKVVRFHASNTSVTNCLWDYSGLKPFEKAHWDHVVFGAGVDNVLFANNTVKCRRSINTANGGTRVFAFAGKSDATSNTFASNVAIENNLFDGLIGDLCKSNTGKNCHFRYNVLDGLFSVPDSFQQWDGGTSYEVGDEVFIGGSLAQSLGYRGGDEGLYICKMPNLDVVPTGPPPHGSGATQFWEMVAGFPHTDLFQGVLGGPFHIEYNYFNTRALPGSTHANLNQALRNVQESRADKYCGERVFAFNMIETDPGYQPNGPLFPISVMWFDLTVTPGPLIVHSNIMDASKQLVFVRDGKNLDYIYIANNFRPDGTAIDSTDGRYHNVLTDVPPVILPGAPAVIPPTPAPTPD